MTKRDVEVEPFVKLIEALDPWLGEVVLVGGWAHRLYRLDPRARNLSYLPLTTLDGDVAVPAKLKVEKGTVRERLLKAGFREEFVGEDHPPAAHYHYRQEGAFYVEFLTPLVGSEYDRRGKRKATCQVGGVSSQQLRYVGLLLVSPWKIALKAENGFPFRTPRNVLVANPTSFLAQKILIYHRRDHKDRAKDLLYMHDTIELFSEHLEELREMYTKHLRPKVHAKHAAKLSAAADELFGEMNDAIREAALITPGRKLDPKAVAETCRAGLEEIFG
jgi:hypothetical protein